MSVLLGRDLREQISHESNVFPITYFEGELADLPGRAGPLHWHPDFEIARADSGTLDYQVGQKHLFLYPGDILFVNGNLLHGMRQVAGTEADPLPIIVFSGTLIAPETGAIYHKYIAPIADCPSLPFVVFRRQDDRYEEVRRLVDEIFACLKGQTGCYEMVVQRNLNRLFEFLFCHLDTLPRFPATRVQLRTQVRVQKMLDYIYRHYADPITLDEIAGAASISRSEASRCFQEYLSCSPTGALIRYRLQTAHRLLRTSSLTVQEIGFACGFRSANYFTRQFRKTYGYAPGHVRASGK